MAAGNGFGARPILLSALPDVKLGSLGDIPDCQFNPKNPLDSTLAAGLYYTVS